jgi:sodium-dependent dicarboxylate transporter 2/3/5
MISLAPGDEPAIGRMAGIAAWMAAWWITEVVPVAMTGLLPLILVPLAGIAPVNEVAVSYSRSTIYLFLGGFLIALGLQTSGAHKRMALFIVHKVGAQPRRLVLGFMLATWALSMWISNTSTTMLMLPIALSVLATARDRGADTALVARLGLAVLLGIAYSANMGGMATLVGTPPNLAFSRLFVQLFPAAPEVDFLQWMMLALPFSASFLVLGWLLLTRVVVKLPDGELMGGHETIGRLRKDLGSMSRDEIATVIIFVMTALLWVSRAGLTLGELRIPGWGDLLGLRGSIDDAVVAIAMAMLLFIVPSRDRAGEHLLEWRMTVEVPWGILLLFGGGFALAAGFTQSGLSTWAGQHFEALRDMSPWVVVAAVCISLTLLTELTSNIATAEMVLPILATAAVTLGLDPRLLMIPATLSASCAFMMPVATPPAAIVYGSGYVPMREMVRAGIWFNALGVCLLLLLFRLLAGPVLGSELTTLPDWAVMP